MAGGMAKGQKEFLNCYVSLIQIDSYCKDLTGWCMTRLRDVCQEKNGLVTFSRLPKVDIKKLKTINEQ